MILGTGDGGRTWRRLPNWTTNHITAMTVGDENTIYLVGYNGMIIKGTLNLH